MFGQFICSKKKELLGKRSWAVRYCIQYNILTEIASTNHFQGGIFYQIFHPLLTTCMIPIVMMFMLNCAIIKRFRNSSANTRNKMRYVCINTSTFQKQARYPNVCDNDDHLRGICVDQHAEDGTGPLRGHHHLQHPRVLRQSLPVPRVLSQVSEYC